MRRDLWMILILGCLLILLLEAPAALSSVSADLDGPYPPRATRMGEVQAAEKPLRAASVHERTPAVPEQAGRRGLGN